MVLTASVLLLEQARPLDMSNALQWVSISVAYHAPLQGLSGLASAGGHIPEPQFSKLHWQHFRVDAEDLE